jgi:hypothetical protein
MTNPSTMRRTRGDETSPPLIGVCSKKTTDDDFGGGTGSVCALTLTPESATATNPDK